MSVQNVSKYRFVVLTMCVTAAFLDYATRTNINNAIVSMVHTSFNSTKNSFVSDYCPIPENHAMLTPNGTSVKHAHLDETFDWDPTTQGAILGAFFYGYIILQIPAGRMAEIFGGKWIVFIGIFGSGVINLLTPVLAKSVGLLIASRVVLGLVQGGVYPAMFTLINVLLKPEEKSIGIGLCHVGGNLGSVAAATLTGYMSQHIGWKSSFYTLGATGVVWTAVWYFVVDDVKSLNAHVKSQSDDTKSEAENIGTKTIDPDGEKWKEMKEPSPSLLDVPWMKIMKNVPIVACIFGRFGASLAYLTLQTKLPGYLKDILHIEPSMNGLLNALLYASTCLSMIGGSYLSEIFIKRAWLSRTNTRKAFTGMGLLVCCISFCIVPSAGCNTILIMILLVISISSYGLTAGGDMIIPAEMSRMYPSTIYSLCNTWANVAGTVTPIAIGSVLNKATDGSGLKQQWDMVFYSVAILVTVTTFVFVVWTSAEYQDDIDCCCRKGESVKIAEKGKV